MRKFIILAALAIGFFPPFTEVFAKTIDTEKCEHISEVSRRLTVRLLTYPGPLSKKNYSLMNNKEQMELAGLNLDDFIGGLFEQLISALIDKTFDFNAFFEQLLSQLIAEFPALSVNPSFTIGFDFTNPTNSWLNYLDATGTFLPNKGVLMSCLQGSNSLACQQLRAFDVMGYVGTAAGAMVNQLSKKEIDKYESKNVSDMASASNVDLIKGGEKEIEKRLNERNAYMTDAVTSYSALPAGKEARKYVPPSLKKQYDALTYKQMRRDSYLKSFQRRLQIHYEKIAALKKLVEQVCDFPSETPETGCVAKKEKEKKKTNVHANYLTQALNGGVVDQIYSCSCDNPDRLIESRGLCGCVCACVHSAAALISATIKDESCKVRERIRMEMTAMRNLQKIYACSSLRLQLEQMVMQLDALEAQAAAMGAAMTQLQNQEFDRFDRKRAKAVLRGYDVPDSGNH